jgi:hypothetical protein
MQEFLSSRGLLTRVRQFKAKNGVFWKAPHVAMRFSGRFL